jgi:hypothetical protein
MGYLIFPLFVLQVRQRGSCSNWSSSSMTGVFLHATLGSTEQCQSPTECLERLTTVPWYYGRGGGYPKITKSEKGFRAPNLNSTGGLSDSLGEGNVRTVRLTEKDWAWLSKRIDSSTTSFLPHSPGYSIPPPLSASYHPSLRFSRWRIIFNSVVSKHFTMQIYLL